MQRRVFLNVAVGSIISSAAIPSPAAVLDLNPGLTGHLWFHPEDDPTYFVADARTGVKTPLVKRPSPNHYLVPARDGKRFLFYTYDNTTGRTNIDVGDMETRQRKGSFSVPGWVSAFRFSPDGRYLAVLRSPSYVEHTDKRGLFVVDLADAGNPRVARDFLGKGDAFVLDFDWLPDGRYLYLRRDRRIVTGTPGPEEATAGMVELPHGMHPAASVALHPKGDCMALVFQWEDGPLAKTDIWVARIDGSRPERVSTTGMNRDPQWSPDGRYLAMMFDTGSSCQAGGCFGVCHRWYVPQDTRNVSDSGQPRLRIYDRSKLTPEGLSCRRDVYWTR